MNSSSTPFLRIAPEQKEKHENKGGKKFFIFPLTFPECT